jgi:LPXTG-motif cell wall-anchored protein
MSISTVLGLALWTGLGLMGLVAFRRRRKAA